jgi:hypothetical protein
LLVSLCSTQKKELNFAGSPRCLASLAILGEFLISLITGGLGVSVKGIRGYGERL